MIAAISILFTLLWLWCRKIDNYSWVDAGWAFGIGLTGVVWLVTQSDWEPKHWAAAALIGFWSFRLFWHLQKRIRKHHPAEDSRYQKLREVLGSFFWFFQAQAVSVVLLALPFYFIARDTSAWGFWEGAGLIVALTGIGGETLADHQMSKFKASNSDSMAVYRDGLWKYSRHPNYFFEGVIWIGFYVFACGSAHGWAMVYAPVIIIFLLLKVTGIPPTEASAVKRKGDAYREYQRTTSAFIPLPPRKKS